MILTDSHCHLDFDEFTQNINPLLQQCQSANITRIIIPAIEPNNWQRVIALSKKHSNERLSLHPCLGIHPWFLNHLQNNALTQLTKMAEQHQSSIIAIGETGVDGTIAQQYNNLNKQLEFFDYQLDLSKKLKKPVIVHHRKSHQHIVPLLKGYKLPKRGIIHAFSGSYQQAKHYLDLGFMLGIGGTITYERAAKTINTVKKLPLDSLLLETDAPSMPLSGFQGETNSPLRIPNVLNALCELRSENKERIIEQLEINYQQLFNDNMSSTYT